MFYLLFIGFAYTAGIFFANYKIDFNLFLYIILCTLILGIFEYSYKRTKIFLTVSVVIFSFIIGSNWYNLNKHKPQNNDLFYYSPQDNIKLEATVINEPKIEQDKITFEIDSEIVVEPYIFVTNGKSIVNLYRSDIDIRYGDKIQITGNLDLPPKSFNPGEFSYRNYLERQGIFSYIIAENIDIIEKETRKDFTAFIIKLRKKLLSTLNNSMPKEAVNIIGSLVFGAKATPVSKDIRDNFTELGLAHILAASGMQISLIVSTGLLFIRFTRINNLLGIGLIILSVTFYIFMTGMPPSILRAGLLNILILLIQYKRETPDTYKILFFVSFIILIFNPLILYDIGFQFSVLATLGLLYISKPLEEKMTFFPDILASVIAMIISAQIMVLPLQLYYFGQFSFLFLISNLIAVLFINLLTYLSIITIILGLIIAPLADMTGTIVYSILSVFIKIVEYLSDLSVSVSYIKKPEIITVIAFYIFIIFMTEILKENIIKISILKKAKFISIALLQTLLIICLIYIQYNKSSDLTVTFINVKQGDSTLIQTPKNKNILIDCGSAYTFTKDEKEISFNASKKYITPYLRHNGIYTIDKLIITHPDIDHIGGCEEIINNFNVLEVWDSGQKDDSEPYSNLLRLIVEKQIPLKVVKYGDNYSENNLKLEVINEIEPDEFDIKSYNNNNSIALRLDYKNQSFLFMSDLEKEAEEKILGENIQTVVLKVGHHGSLTSSTEEFLMLSRPQYSVISSGKNNRYKHPREEVLERLNFIGSKVYRTDQDGGIIFKTNGENMNIKISE